MTSCRSFVVFAAACAAVVALSATSALAQEKDLATKACENLVRLAGVFGEPADATPTVEQCRTELASMHDDCTNSDEVLACFAAVDGKTEEVVGEAFMGCAMKCIPSGETSATPAVEPTPEIKKACENLAAVAKAAGEDVKPEDMPDCYQGLTEVVGRCSNREAVVSCVTGIETKDGFDKCMETCQ